MKYKELKTGIRDHLNNAAEDFFMVGYYLRQISDNTLFIEDGYKSIWDFAKGEYGLSTSSASRFMAINARFSIDGGEHMDQKYIGMGPSKLQEMLGLSDEDLEKVTQETTVKELRAMKAAKLSYFKLPKTEYEEGSLLTTPGCGHKHDCFSCCHPCNIRQEERLCTVSTIAEGRRCPHTTEDFLKDVEAGMYKDGCQFLHLELAEVRAGDQEPSPCCRACQYKGLCFSCCDVAKKEYEKAKEQERRMQEREAERKRLEAEAERATKEAAKRAADQKKQEAAKQAQLKAKEDDFIKAFYENLYDSEKLLIKERKRAEITKLFKTEYGSRYENTHTDEVCWSCYPDKICFTLSGFGTSLQITWGKFTTKLLQLLNTYPDIESAKVEPGEQQEEQQEKEPEIIDAEFKEVEDKQPEPEQQGQQPEETESEKAEVEVVDPEQYERQDVLELLEKFERDLKAIRKSGLVKPLKKNRILVDALKALLEAKEGEDD